MNTSKHRQKNDTYGKLNSLLTVNTPHPNFLSFKVAEYYMLKKGGNYTNKIIEYT